MTVIPTATVAASRYGEASPYLPAPNTLTPQEFARLPAGVQADFVRAYGSGNPPTVLVGVYKGLDQPRIQAGGVIATLRPSGDVETVAAPLPITERPDRIAVDAFRSWPSAAQILYVQANGGGAPLTIGPYGADVSATLARDAQGRATGVDLASSAAVTAQAAGVLATPPAALSAAAFFALLPDEQAAYAQAHRDNPATDAQGNLLPPRVAIAGAGSDGAAVTLTRGGRSLVVVVPAGTYPGFADALTGQASAVQGFATWPRAVQQAYVEARAAGPADAYPKTVVVTAANLVASVAGPGGAVDTAPLPAGFGGPVTATTFLDFPAAAQIAYARTRLRDLGQTPPLVLLGTGGQTLQVRLADGQGGAVPGGIALSSPADLAIGPANLDADLFGYWPQGEQARYFNAHATGTPKSLAVGSAAGAPGRGLLTLDAAGRPGLAPYPLDFDTAPAALTPSAFLAWSPAFRALYVAARGTADPVTGTKIVQLTRTVPADKPGLPMTLTASVTGAGILTVSSDTLKIDPSIAMTLNLPDPTEHVDGGIGGLSHEPNRTAAETLFPILDGNQGQTAAGAAYRLVDKTPAVATAFAKLPAALTPAEFGQWHSAIQLEYLRTKGTDKTVTYTRPDGTSATVTVKSAEIGVAPKSITAFISTSGTKVITVEALQKTDIGKMPLADQAILGTLPAFTAKLTETFGLVAGDGERSNVQAIVDALAALIRTPGNDPNPKGGDGRMATADKQVFLDQLTIITDKLKASAIFSPKDINDQVDEIRGRFERANAFAAAMIRPAPKYDPLTGEGIVLTATKEADNAPITALSQLNMFLAIGLAKVTKNGADSSISDLIGPIPADFTGTTFTRTFNPAVRVAFQALVGGPVTISLSELKVPVVPKPSAVLATDGNKAITQGYDTFMAQERQILNLATRRQGLARSGTIPDSTQNLDVPNLVYLFQLYSNLTGEAKIRADTEEINQTNALLKTYAVMQNLINTTLKQFDPKSTDQTGGLRGNGARNATAVQDGFEATGLTDEEFAVAAMFKKGSPASQVLHPIEALKGLRRPPDDFPNNRKMTVWQTYGQQLSDAVTLINQESQIRMNEINSSTKAKDRNFDLANNALSKMNEIVQKIANAA